ncbi:MAG TPA: hypothetical protein VLA48_03000 [Nitrososphaeraceae archaeon]|nr:hypothetical protein [Nitrososphaeraceae archaeon]
MTTERFKELEERNKDNPMQLCFEIFNEEKSRIPLSQFEQMFTAWLHLFKGGDIYSAIEYFKNNKVR